jgi:DNA-binding GntR family transcriptional regulator
VPDVSAAIEPALCAPSRQPSLAVRIADALVDGIAGGAIEPGERLVETEIAARIGVSRVPLREALKLLEAQGIVEVLPHRGARVVPFDDTRVDRVCEARVALERLALRTAVPAFEADPTRLATLDRLIDAMLLAARRQAWLEASKADLAFHRTMVEASGNDIVAKLWEALARHVLIVFGREVRTERAGPQLVRQHVRLRNLLAASDLATLLDEIEPHILRLRPARPAELARAPHIVDEILEGQQDRRGSPDQG